MKLCGTRETFCSRFLSPLRGLIQSFARKLPLDPFPTAPGSDTEALLDHELSDAQKNVYRQLIKPFIRQYLLCQFDSIQRQRFDLIRFGPGVSANWFHVLG